ncbi:fatty acid synthase subunit beta domain-containing protein [Corynebacterium sp. H78]|uniref:fatty acid synthase subunit beta domain-containing protein n=1 Tax=Corynebacterium sp. H78 TaxID=3133417 RepID=UPI0030ABE58B
MVQRLASGEKFALSFAGQGLRWVETLATCVSAGTDSRVRELLAEVEERLRPIAPSIAGQRPDGFAPLTWANQRLNDETVTANLNSPAVSVPGILTAQLAVLDLLSAQGLPVEAAVSAIGHSQGALGAAAAEDPSRAADVLAVAELIGVAIARHSRLARLVQTGENTDAASGPMMMVKDARAEQVTPFLAGNAVVGLINDRETCVVVGNSDDLAVTKATLEAVAKKDARQLEAKIRGGKPFTPSFSRLPVDGGFHHPSMSSAVDDVVAAAEKIGIEEAFARPLAEHVMTDAVDWPREVASAVDEGATVIVEVGPEAGVATLTRRLVAGLGVTVVAAATDEGQEELFQPGSAPAAPTEWAQYLPTVVAKPTPRLETAFTRLTGRSPILLGGMTPTTVDPAIVAAAANAGFWAELAGGGQVTPEIFQENVERLHELLDEGASAQFNTMFLDPYLWGMHIGSRRLVQRAVAAGRPIDGVTISAGIPETDEAVALVAELRAAGIPYISVKPGTVNQIRQVLAIADALEEDERTNGAAALPIIIQVEGGRAGGHHSWEELDDLLIATYADIRDRKNVVLSVGGGIGQPEQAAEYLLGRWSEKLGYPAMPVDSIIIGTAAMAAKESTASAGVKKMLVDTAGTAEWVPAGGAAEGMASGRSQLGADIHEIDNAAARAGRLLDEVANDADAVAARRDEIIEAINSTAKPYFGDVDAMTYREVLDRYLELATPDGEFIDPSWATRFMAIVDQFEARLAETDEGEFNSVIDADEARALVAGEVAATAIVDKLAANYNLDLRLHPADVEFFITNACRTPGKPVNFVPVIDAEVRRWWRSDSLWQAHDERYDADGVCIIPGTAAVAGITKADEPVAEILGRFEQAAIAELSVADSAQDDAAVELVQRVIDAPTIWWAGRQQQNPVQLLGAPAQWSASDADSGVFAHAETGATVTADAADAVVLRVPLEGSGADDHELTLRLTVTDKPGATPVVTAADATEAMRALTTIAAGGVLPEVVDGVATWETTWTATGAADHDAVTGATQATAPDALVGLAWPAIFSAVSSAKTETGIDVVEGMLALVHLEHHIRMAQELPADGTALTITAHTDDVSDTEMGRVVVVRAEINDANGLVATLSERFAIRGRNGNSTALVNTVPLPTVTDTPRSHRAELVVTAPYNMEPFATVSGDRNPIHVDDRAAALAGLPGVIVHGMWLSAVAEHAAIHGVSAGLGQRVTEFTTTMLQPVLPGQEVTYTVERRGLDDRPGNFEVREVTATVDGEPVLTATAVIEAPATCYAFPGQGIQSKGMGLAARNRSAAARKVWDDADRVTRENLGFSVLAIVRDNPTEVVVDGHRFYHPEGVLNLTQFTQVSMATLGMAQAAEMREAGVLDETAYFAGHSVGEYNALAAFAGVIDNAAVLEVVYHRGLTMHSLVPRDEEGRSNYGLSALRPDKIGVKESEVKSYVAAIAEESGEFLEVVNFNLAGKQYAVAGTVAGLAALEAAAKKASPDGKGYVRIPGIDVPFHSAVLRDGVDEFRGHLDRLLPEEVNPEALVGRYIPNLTATCFALTETFVREMAEVADSDILRDILTDFDAHAAKPGRLTRTLLVELLAWQFCSPVRWIETQDLLFGELGVSRMIEVGVGTAPTLANLAARTALLPRHATRDITIWNVERDADAVFARDEVRLERDDDPAEEASASEAEEAAEAAPAAAPAAAPVATSAERPADITVTPADAVEILIALWTKVRPDQMGAADSIETLVDGVSSRRNQLLLDLGAEFGLGSIDGAADADLPSLKDKVGGMVRGYTPWGPVLGESIADGLRRVTGPAGARANHVTDRVTDVWQLGEGWAQATCAELVLGSREGASLRGGDLGHLTQATPGTKAELDQLIDAAVQAVGANRGVAVTMPAAGGAGGGGVVDSAALGEFAEQVTGSSGVLATAARTILSQLGHEMTGAVDFDSDDADEKLVELVTAELGADWPKLVTPSFDANKAVLIDDRWATSREDLAAMWAGKEAPSTISATAVEQARFWATKADNEGRQELAAAYRDLADNAVAAGAGEFANDVAVVTGGSPDSIAASVIAELLAGGATVIATTSRLSHSRLTFYRELYRTHAIDGAALWVLPANLTSYQDLDALVDWVGNEQTATVGADSVVLKPALTPSLLFPFAAPGVSGSLADAGPAAEMQMRLLLWSVERLIAGLSDIGTESNIRHRLHVVLPGSPNRGRFGGDGAYGESKAALDAVVTRWNAEEIWGKRTSLVHAHIGWVRGTGLMGGNDPLVETVEAKGVRTYATEEMAQLLVEQASADARAKATTAPITVDLTGGLGDVDLNMSALAAEAAEAAAAAGKDTEEGSVQRALKALPGVRTPLDSVLPEFVDVKVEPEDMVVIVGAAELGPYGSSRTRFEAEVGEISAAGIVELAWTMGLISYDGGWLDADDQPLEEADIVERYRDEVTARVGVRRYGDDGDLVDNTMTELTTVYLDRDLSFPVRDRAAAATFVESDPENTYAMPDEESGEWIVTRKSGTAVQVPRRMAMSRYVGGQIPEGFDPAVYGIPADMMDNLDRVSLWNLVCTVDAFLASGFSPAELLQAVHPGLVSSTQGTGIGAMESLRSLYIDGILGLPRANDVLQEALPNVIAAHVMQSYVGGYGQMIHPVAACATAAVSVEEGYDKIKLGKSDFVVAGGFDDLSTEGITGFGDMAATADSATMDAKGIERKYFSRANDRRRGGFVESQGGGTVLLARGSVARDLGLPVLGVVAFAESFADGAHTSIPAPGLGALGAARGGEKSRLARQLAAHGVGANDVAILSKHDTSTNANDPNESELHERIADAIGRDEANPLFVVSQKSLTGHAKGGAAAFQMIGLTQVLRSGVVPANRSLDCVDPVLSKHGRLVWATKPLNFGEAMPLKAGLVTSLGFGHVSALVAIAHPEAFYASLVANDGPAVAAQWREAAGEREAAGLRRIDDAIYGGDVLYERPEGRRLGDGGEYGDKDALEKAAILNPEARLVDGILNDNPAQN